MFCILIRYPTSWILCMYRWRNACWIHFLLHCSIPYFYGRDVCQTN